MLFRKAKQDTVYVKYPVHFDHCYLIQINVELREALTFCRGKLWKAKD